MLPLWCYPGAESEAASGDDDNLVPVIAIPVVAAILLAAVIYGIVRAVRQIRRDSVYRVSSPRDNTAKSSHHGGQSSEHRDSVASGVSAESQYYEYEYE